MGFYEFKNKFCTYYSLFKNTKGKVAKSNNMLNKVLSI